MKNAEHWVVFDYGGTLASPSPRITCDNLGAYFSEVLPEALGVPFRDALRRNWNEAETRGKALALDVSLCSILHDVFLELDLPFVGTQNIVDSFLRQLGDGIVSPSAVAAVRQVKDMGFKIGLASNTLRSSKVRRESLRQAGIEDAFSAVIVSSEVGFRKPHPVFFEILLRRIGVSPEQVTFVGDTWHKDVLAPIEAGMRAIWLTGTPPPASTGIPHATPFVTDIAQLPSVLGDMHLPC